MFMVVLSERVNMDVPMVKQFRYPPYLLASAIESPTALLRACSNCGMLRSLPEYPSISFIVGMAGLGEGVDFGLCGGTRQRGSFLQGHLYLRQTTGLTPRALFLPVFTCRRRMDRDGASFRWVEIISGWGGRP